MYKKYDTTKLGWCNYPFENDPLGYCWGYAGLVDKKSTIKEIKKYCKKCDLYWEKGKKW